MTDRTYWHGDASWHAIDPASERPRLNYAFYCGRSDWFYGRGEVADRVPSHGHLCGSCSRSIAARTDIEDSEAIEASAAAGRQRVADWMRIHGRRDSVSDQPEPVASEQDDYDGAAAI
jgi:hypothetical protein